MCVETRFFALYIHTQRRGVNKEKNNAACELVIFLLWAGRGRVGGGGSYSEFKRPDCPDTTRTRTMSYISTPYKKYRYQNSSKPDGGYIPIMQTCA